MTRFDACRFSFPPVTSWPEDGDVVAIGADLEPDTLLHAYAHGMFPMHVDSLKTELGWWSPVMRGIIPLDGLRVTRSMRRSARRYRVTMDHSFEDVVRRCGSLHREGNWITEDFVRSYVRLHRMGHAHSVEVTDSAGNLVGGLYGVRIDRFFAGESMFHTATDASKVALMHLVDWLRSEGVTLLDTQWCTEHLSTLGCIEVDRDEYLRLLAGAVD